jgi:hypothetical protein
MGNNAFLLMGLAKASLLTTTVWFALIVGPMLLGVSLSANQEAIQGFVIVISSTALAGWWMLKILRSRFSRREAKFMMVTFVVCTPVSLLVAIVLAVIPGAYAGIVGRPAGLLGALTSIVIVNALLNWGPCLLAAWLARRTSSELGHEAELQH